MSPQEKHEAAQGCVWMIAIASVSIAIGALFAWPYGLLAFGILIIAVDKMT